MALLNLFSSTEDTKSGSTTNIYDVLCSLCNTRTNLAEALVSAKDDRTFAAIKEELDRNDATNSYILIDLDIIQVDEDDD